MPSDEDDGNLYAGIGELALEIDAAESGQTHVEDKAAGAGFGKLG